MADGESLSVETRPLADRIHEVRIQGALDWSNFSKVEGAIDELFGRGIYNVVVNLEQVNYISSAGFGCFIQSLDTAINNGGKIIFSRTPDRIKEIFDILGLSHILTFAGTEQEALAQFETAKA
jgi:anti-sigma B factor antagonist